MWTPSYSVPESYTQLAAEVQQQVTGPCHHDKTERIIHYQTPCVRLDCIHHTSAPTLSHSHFILAYAQQGLVEKFNVLQILVNHTATATAICHQTYIVHIHPLPKEKQRGTRYVWVHTNIRPWVSTSSHWRVFCL